MRLESFVKVVCETTQSVFSFFCYKLKLSRFRPTSLYQTSVVKIVKIALTSIQIFEVNRTYDSLIKKLLAKKLRIIQSRLNITESA